VYFAFSVERQSFEKPYVTFLLNSAKRVNGEPIKINNEVEGNPGNFCNL
jgi:hypothetical protein